MSKDEFGQALSNLVWEFRDFQIKTTEPYPYNLVGFGEWLESKWKPSQKSDQVRPHDGLTDGPDSPKTHAAHLPHKSSTSFEETLNTYWGTLGMIYGGPIPTSTKQAILQAHQEDLDKAVISALEELKQTFDSSEMPFFETVEAKAIIDQAIKQRKSNDSL